MKRTGVAIALTVLALYPQGAIAGVEVHGNPRSDGVVLRSHVVRPNHGRPRSNRGSSQARAAPKSPCTYSGILVICTPPRRGRVSGTVFTPGLAREAVATIPLPGLTLHVQPDGETLVNVETIFWAEPEPFETSIDLLGHTIDVRATPASFTWVHGDGTSQTTNEPGRPYPRLDITHRYEQPAALHAQVVTTYDVRYRVDGGGWTDLDEPLVAPGPQTAIDVHEAAPVLAR